MPETGRSKQTDHKRSKKKPESKIAVLWRKKQSFRIAVYIAAAVLVICLAVDLVKVLSNPIRTLDAKEEVLRISHDIEYYMIRDESYITSDKSGVIVPLKDEGERAAVGEEIIAVFNNEDEAANYLEYKRLSAALERYTELSSFTYTYSSNVEDMTAQIDEVFCAYLNEIIRGDVQQEDERLSDFRDEATMREIIMGTAADFSKKIESVKAQMKKYSDSQKYSAVTAEKAGFFSTAADGYEQSYSYKNALSLNPDGIETLLEAEAEKIPDNVRGRLVSNYNWYICFVLPTDTAKSDDLEVGDSYSVMLPIGGMNSEINVKIAALNANGDKTAVVCSSNTVDMNLLNMRTGEAKFVTEKYTGYKIPKSAVRSLNDDGKAYENGVYVLTGNIVKFKKVNIVFENDEFIISSNPVTDGKENTEYVALYDKVIVTRTKGLYDGKVVY